MAAKEDYTLAPEAEFKLMGAICQREMDKGYSFGNAREMRLLLDETIGRLSERVADMNPANITSETYKLITPDDVEIL